MHEVLEWTALAVDMVAVVVMAVGFGLAVVKFVPTLGTPAGPESIFAIQMVRCSLGTYIVFALELMIISDLIHSIVSRTLDDLYFLGGIVVMRTVIAYFLSKEIEELREQAA